MDEDIEILTEAIRRDPENADAYFNRGVAYIKKEEWNNAIADFDKIIEISHGNSATYFNRGSAYFKKGELDNAIADYTKAIELAPKNLLARSRRGLSYGQKGEWNKAIADFDKVIELNPQDFEAYVGRGIAYGEKRESGKAIADYDKAIELSPNNFQTYFHRGIIYNDKKELDKAIADYDKAIELAPQNSSAYFNRGISYGEKGELNKAIADFNKTVELNPANLEAHANRGVIYGRKGKFDNAIKDFDKMIVLTPSNPDAYSNRGTIYIKKGEWDKAIADFDKAIELNPQHWGAYSNRGFVYLQKEQLDKAIADFDKAIELAPQNSDAYFNRGATYAKKKELDKAISDFTKAIEINFEDSDAYFNRGLSYASKEELDNATTDWDTAIRLNPRSPNAYFSRGRVYLMEEDYAHSFEYFTRADKLNPTLKFTYIDVYVASRINVATRSVLNSDKPEVIENYLKLTRLMEAIQSTLIYEPQEFEVAHYTSLDALKSLVGKKAFRLYNSIYMNDPEEGRIFFRVMNKIIADPKIDFEDIFYGKTENRTYRSPAYIGSFVKLDASEQKDKLFLWRTYGKHNGEEAGGSCLIFPRASFAEIRLPQIGTMLQQADAHTKLEEKQSSKPTIYEIVYIDNKEQLPKLSAELHELANCLKKIDRIIDRISKDNAKNELKQLACELLDGIRFLFKASHYQEEKEVRVIQFHYRNENEPQQSDGIKVDVEQTPPRFYLETPQDFRSNEVMLGPSSRNFEDWQWWLEEQGMKVDKSTIKYVSRDS